MDENQINTGHISTSYDEAMSEVQSKTLEMSGVVESSYSDALSGLIKGDSSLSQKVATNDFLVNKLEIDIDEKCNTILALQTPVASDLRTIIVVLRIITDLERVGDEAEKIARLSLKLNYENIDQAFLKSLEHLGNSTSALLHNSIDAYARKSVEQALEVIQDDKKIDLEFKSCMRQLITYIVKIEDNKVVKNFLDISTCAKSIERIGDHAKNIAQHTIYLIKGKDIRHTRIEQVRSELDEI
jgi:phosphate transport system protein